LTCGIPRPTRTQASRCGTPLLWLLFLTLKSDPQLPSHFFYSRGITRARYRVPSVSPTSKSQQTLATAKFLTHFIISIGGAHQQTSERAAPPVSLSQWRKKGRQLGTKIKIAIISAYGHTKLFLFYFMLCC
jgi:hypothetical protein